MARESEIAAAIDSVYAAATDIERWPDALHAICSCLGCAAMNLVMEGPELPEQGVVASYGFDPELVRVYNEHYIRVDPVNSAGQSLQTGGFVASNQLMSDQEWIHTELYTDLQRPYDLFYIAGSMVERRPDGYAGMGLLRSRRAGPFDEEVRDLYARFLPHLQRAVALQRRLARVEHRATTLAAALDRLDVAVVLVDHSARVAHANAAAQATLRTPDGLAVHHRRLVCARSNESTVLRALISGASSRGSNGLPSGGVLQVSRPSGRQALQLEVTPLAGESSPDGLSRAAAVVVFSDPGRNTPSMAKRLVQSYGLTRAEARLTETLVAGSSLQDASDRLNVSVNTLRTQLRAVFAKTDTTRQSDLLRLLLSGPFALVRDEEE